MSKEGFSLCEDSRNHSSNEANLVVSQDEALLFDSAVLEGTLVSF